MNLSGILLSATPWWFIEDLVHEKHGNTDVNTPAKSDGTFFFPQILTPGLSCDT
jgi:hypothetical protein